MCAEFTEYVPRSLARRRYLNPETTITVKAQKTIDREAVADRDDHSDDHAQVSLLIQQENW